MDPQAFGATYWGASGPQPEKSGKSGESASRPLGRSPGTLGWAGIFSFDGNKIITTSGGGMLVSADKGLIEHARKLSTQARDPAPHNRPRRP